MKEGKITQAGRYNEILDSGTDFMERVGAHTDALATVDTYEQGCDSSESTTNKEKEAPRDEEKLEKDSGKPSGGQLVQQEEREKGKVGFTVYKKYMALAYGGAVIPIILLVQILFQVLDIGSNYWMTWVTPVSWQSEEQLMLQMASELQSQRRDWRAKWNKLPPWCRSAGSSLRPTSWCRRMPGASWCSLMAAAAAAAVPGTVRLPHC